MTCIRRPYRVADRADHPLPPPQGPSPRLRLVTRPSAGRRGESPRVRPGVSPGACLVVLLLLLLVVWGFLLPTAHADAAEPLVHVPGVTGPDFSPERGLMLRLCGRPLLLVEAEDGRTVVYLGLHIMARTALAEPGERLNVLSLERMSRQLADVCRPKGRPARWRM